ncbi:rhamnogalacturonan lyase [Isoptericola sp. NPDC019571]|uniref:rhamnogalacturonan lyase n=1 Tax=Isoptericola sp. NPDC019571 TaxID=3364008 RepID=UPI0037A8842C
MTRRGVIATTSIALCLALSAGSPAVAGPAPGHGADHHHRVQLENLDRGLVAAATEQGVFLSWRLLGNEATGHGQSGLTGTDFAVYRGKTKVATVTDSTNYLDPEGTTDDTYRVVPITAGRERGHGETVRPWSQNYVDLPLQRPPDGVTPAGEAYTYAGAPSGRKALSGANDMSVGDVDGDGELEYVVKWEPSNSKDVSQVGYTGPVFLDTYELDGTLRHRISLGPNIRAGAHYTQFLVYDFDGDGRAEIMLKTAPRTKTTSYRNNHPAKSRYITLPKQDRKAGVTHADDYRLSSDGYYEHIVDMFKGWSTHPEVVAGNWPATLEEAFGIEPRYDYPLSDTDARAMADYFMDVFAPSRSSKNKLRDFEGYILSGPEYLTVFDGATGSELETVPYEPGRTDDGLMWGDYANPRIEPGNRVDRFLSGVAYLDGRHPSAIFSRGYYTRATVAAYDWDGRHLTKRWLADSGWERRTNPFGGDWSPTDDPEWGPLGGQGFHSLSAADVDGDGKQEIVYGSATLDDDGSLLYSSSDVMPPESSRPGEVRPLGHGDAMHVADIDPARPGLEIFTSHENSNAPYGMVLRRAEDGTAIFGHFGGADIERAMVGDVVPGSPGLEVGASQPKALYAATGEKLGDTKPGANMSIRWSADMTTQIVTGEVTDTVDTPRIEDWNRGTLLTADGTLTNNHSKGNPSLVGDLFGDWREELALRTADSSAIRIYTSTEVTDHKLYTLLHDVQYRAELARQQTGYNQPTYTSFYLGSDTDWADVPLPRYDTPSD